MDIIKIKPGTDEIVTLGDQVLRLINSIESLEERADISEDQMIRLTNEIGCLKSDVSYNADSAEKQVYRLKKKFRLLTIGFATNTAILAAWIHTAIVG